MDRLRVVVVGGGVAGLETLLALRALAGDAVRLHLISPGDDFVYRPLEVVEPFDSRTWARIPWARILHDRSISRMSTALREVDVDACLVRTTTAQSVPFDLLVLAPGAGVKPALAGAITVGAPGAMRLFGQVLARIRGGQMKRIAFAVPPGVTWTLPIYELALMTAPVARGAHRGRGLHRDL
jgi:sulfide:quinone oxidoreductase